MNNTRRKAIKVIVNSLWELDAVREKLCSDLQEIIDQEQNAFDNLPESLQMSERGEQIENYIDTMEGALADLEGIFLNVIAEDLADICENI